LAGIYLHIPFCKQACSYCNFHFTTSLHYKDDLVKALAKEIELEKDYPAGEEINTIYFGGGTPSILKIEDLSLMMEGIRRHYKVGGEAEITLEANPDDITRDKVRGWKDLGVNRLSIGIQSFFEEELKWMNRAHTAAHAKQCIEIANTEGISNLSIDLIYGSPLLSDKMWEENVKTAIEYNIPHLSCYALTVEEKTPLHKQIESQAKEKVDEEKQGRQFLLLMDWLKLAGYEHYEVSNFSKPGCRSRHNSSYWKGEKYLGVGPSAHSYNGTERRWNVYNNTVYIKGIIEGTPGREVEVLTTEQKFNEYVMISLRTIEGMSIDEIERGWGSEWRDFVKMMMTKYVEQGLVAAKDNRFQLTREGMLFADGIASDLFV
jgi:oxygen-independent coproporphyrinogen III oxidase